MLSKDAEALPFSLDRHIEVLRDPPCLRVRHHGHRRMTVPAGNDHPIGADRADRIIGRGEGEGRDRLAEGGAQ